MSERGAVFMHSLQSQTVFAGLGSTVSELNVSHCPVFPKTQFSMVTPEVENHLKTLPSRLLLTK
jgi:hypothetical protein